MDTDTEGAVTQQPRYHRANAWPTEIPRLTRVEAQRARCRLFKKFLGRAPRNPTKVRRVWVPVKPPFNTLHRGWRRLVHDVSHQLHSIKHPDRRDHDFRHEWLEGEMVEFVLASGWLQGKLRPPEKAKRPPQEVRYERIAARLTSWERKFKRAQTAIRKLRAQKMYYERRQAT